MFTATESPTGHFTLLPIPNEFFELPSPFGNGAMLILNQFNNNSDKLLPAHMIGVQIAASQAAATFGAGNGALECYGVTDRTGSEELNKDLSIRRANGALDALRGALNLQERNVTFANGLGERFADEYFQQPDKSRNPNLRGVACYLWESFSTSQDVVLRLEISFAAPPTGGGPKRRAFLGPLHMGRLRTQPRSVFA